MQIALVHQTLDHMIKHMKTNLKNVTFGAICSSNSAPLIECGWYVPNLEAFYGFEAWKTYVIAWEHFNDSWSFKDI